eukprot:8272514-Pyramimonas_sp.AAC.1
MDVVGGGRGGMGTRHARGEGHFGRGPARAAKQRRRPTVRSMHLLSAQPLTPYHRVMRQFVSWLSSVLVSEVLSSFAPPPEGDDSTGDVAGAAV